MIPKISRGGKMGGLCVYLFGPGRHNEHFDRHLLTASPVLLHEQWLGVFTDSGNRESDSRRVALELGRALDLPRQLHEVRVTKWAANARVAGEHGRGLDTIADPKRGEERVKRDAHVWHCSLSLEPEEGRLSDEKWSEIVADFMREMGFDDPSKAGARWIAVRHGLARNGGDHVHIAASLVREDGSVVDTYFRDPDNGNAPRGDRGMAQAVVNKLEHRHGLEVLSSREEGGRGRAGASAAEVERKRREQRPETERETLHRLVRAYAGAAVNEQEFVRGLRAAGVAVWPRWAPGGQTEVSGYFVQLRRDSVLVGPRLGGKRLAADLSLPALREQMWTDSPEARAEALATWRRGNPHDTGSTTAGDVDPTTLWHNAAREALEWERRLRDVPVGDHEQWKWVAGQTAAVYAAWSVQIEGDDPGPFAAAATELTRSAQTRYARDRHRPATPAGVRNVGMGDVTRRMISLWQSNGHQSYCVDDVSAEALASLAALGVALVALIVTIAKAHRARDELSRALAVEHIARERLEAVHRGWTDQIPRRRERDHEKREQAAALAEPAEARQLLDLVRGDAPAPPAPQADQRWGKRYLDMTPAEQHGYRVGAVSRPPVQPRRWTTDLLNTYHRFLRGESTDLRDYIGGRRTCDGPMTVQALADNVELAAEHDTVRAAQDARQRAEDADREQRGLSARLAEVEATLSQTLRLRVRVRDQLHAQADELKAKIEATAPRVNEARRAAAAAAARAGSDPQEWPDILRESSPDAQECNLWIARAADKTDTDNASQALQHVDYELRLVEAERARRAKLTPEQEAAERPPRVDDLLAGTRPGEADPRYIHGPTQPHRSPRLDLTQDRDRDIGR